MTEYASITQIVSFFQVFFIPNQLYFFIYVIVYLIPLVSILQTVNKYDPFRENVPKCADKRFSDLLIKA